MSKKRKLSTNSSELLILEKSYTYCEETEQAINWKVRKKTKTKKGSSNMKILDFLGAIFYNR